MKKILLLILLTPFFICNLLANNVQITNLVLDEQHTDANYVYFKFDLSWENSWRNATNWDAVWLFAKYKTTDGVWHHAALSSTGSNHETGSIGLGAYMPDSDGNGVFIYRANQTTGTFSSTGVRLYWLYGSNGLQDALDTYVSEIQVFGIEMVNIPLANFYLGSGGTESYHFYTYPTSTATYQITSEVAINVGQTNGYLWAAGDVESGQQVPADFPKGRNEFYCMKYEISQEQYVAFLNTLTYTQQASRVANAPNSSANTLINTGSLTYRNGIKIQTPGVSSTTPAVFGCDLNDNNTYDESDDGQNIACNYLSWPDGVAYADWAGLRPMSELEFEKACRGNAAAVANEYAWGSTNITMASTISNSGAANESVSSGNCNYNDGITPIFAPIRVGIYSGGSRQTAGSSYYGVMDLSGNLWERAVTIANGTGRNYTRVLGDGALDASGDANQQTWPGTDAIGSGFRGGSWLESSTQHQVSDRQFSGTTSATRSTNFGFRCVR